jgi:hypothetical protein
MELPKNVGRNRGIQIMENTTKITTTTKSAEKCERFYAVYVRDRSMGERNIAEFSRQIDICNAFKIEKSRLNHAIKSGDFIYSEVAGAIVIYEIIEE